MRVDTKHLKFLVYGGGEVVAAFSHAEDAALFVASVSEPGVLIASEASGILWIEGPEGDGFAVDSAEFCAAVIHTRRLMATEAQAS